MQANFMNNKNNQKICSVVVNDNQELTPLKLNYTGEMNGGILTMQIHQFYKNGQGNKDSPDSKVVLILPKNRTHCITGIEFLLNDQKINLKIEEQNTAKQIADEGEKQGRATVRSDTTADDQFLNIHLGSIPHDSEFQITIRMEIISTNSDSKTYQTIVPFTEQTLDSTIPDNFSFSIVFNEIIPIDDVQITCSYERSDFEYTFDGSILTIDRKPLGPIVIVTRLKNDIPSSIQNDLHDEYSVISVIPHFLNKQINSDFIFIVDCSGSMSGSRIRNASECLSIFVHSLPVGCKFSIIKFGSHYESVFGSSGLVDYNERNLQRADQEVNDLKANLGGTNLLGPLEYAYEQIESNTKEGNVVQIFVLTDGEIHDTEKVFKLVNKNRSKSRIFSIGIGKDADRNLVSGLSLLSFGKFDFVSEASQITDKIANLLNLSLSPALTNVSIHASSGEEGVDSIEIVPNPLTPIYDGNLTYIYVKRNSDLKLIDNVLITGNLGDEETEIVIDEVANCSNLSAKNLFAFTAISDYEKLYDELKEKDSSRNRRNRFWLHNNRHENEDKNDDSNEVKEMTKLRDRIVTLSVENGILSKFTSYVGVENNPHKNSIQEEEIEYDDNNEVTIQPLMATLAKMQSMDDSDGENEIDGFASSKRHRSQKSSNKKEKAAPKRSAHRMMRNYEAEELEDRMKVEFLEPESRSYMDYEADENETDKSPPPQMHYQSNRAAPPQMNFAQMMTFCSAAPSQNSSIEMIGDLPQMNNYQCTNEAAPAPRFNEKKGVTITKAFAAPAPRFNEGPTLMKECAAPIGACMSPSSSFTPPPPVRPRIENSVTGIVKSQQFDGRWKSDLFEQLIELVDSEKRHFLVEFLDSLGVKEDEDGGNIKSTVVALCVLNKSFQSEELKWRQVQRKAVMWLNSKLQKNWEAEIKNLASLI